MSGDMLKKRNLQLLDKKKAYEELVNLIPLKSDQDSVEILREVRDSRSALPLLLPTLSMSQKDLREGNHRPISEVVADLRKELES